MPFTHLLDELIPRMRILIFVIGWFLFLSLNGCVSYKQLLSYQDELLDSTVVKRLIPPKIIIQPNDVLSINVHGSDQETAAPFNLEDQNNFGFSVESVQLSGYLVDEDESIDFPVLGNVKLGGLTTTGAKKRLTELLKDYLKEPVVNIRLLNFRVTVSGEVLSPGSFSVTNERLSIPDALALAGGLTDYANRANILVVREIGEEMILNRVNLQNTDFFTSEYYYLKQNDLIYVEPLKSKAGAVSDQTNKVVPIVSAVGALIAIVVALIQ